MDGTVAAALITEGVCSTRFAWWTTFIFPNYDTLRRDIVAELKSVASVCDAPWIFTSISPKDKEETRYKEVSSQEGLLARVDNCQNRISNCFMEVNRRYARRFLAASALGATFDQLFLEFLNEHCGNFKFYSY